MGASTIMTLLSMRGVDFRDVARGGAPFDKSAVMAALAGTSEPAYRLGMVMFLADDHSRRILLQYVANVIVRDFEFCNPGQAVEPELGVVLANTLLLEFFSGEGCSECNGTGVVREKSRSISEGKSGPLSSCRRERVTAQVQCGGNKVDVALQAGRKQQARPCKSCDGGGIQRWSVRRSAKMASLNDRTYSRRYRAAREAGYRAVCAWLDDLDHELEARLFGRSDGSDCE